MILSTISGKWNNFLLNFQRELFSNKISQSERKSSENFFIIFPRILFSFALNNKSHIIAFSFQPFIFFLWSKHSLHALRNIHKKYLVWICSWSGWRRWKESGRHSIRMMIQFCPHKCMLNSTVLGLVSAHHHSPAIWITHLCHYANC